ncbi:MAG: DoxX family protein [Bacteroidetes bacterium]|nr:DoxX family protein [Bacteroidota bacterium]
MKYFVIFSRIFVGVLFILSGFVKVNDPLGFSYKLDEYFTVFGMTWMIPYSLFLSVFTSALEIILGAALLAGYRMVPVTWLLLLMIIFFTWLTGYSAVTGKVTDCGCFGDAVKLKPVQSFFKDIILLVFILILFLKRKAIKLYMGVTAGHLYMGMVSVLTLGFAIWCYRHLPLIDFRPYAIGKNIPGQMVIPEGAPVDEWEVMYTLQNKKSGESKKMTSKDYIAQKVWEDTTWMILNDKTENKLITEGYHPPVHDFSITDMDGNDFTDSVLQFDGYLFLFIAYDLNKSSRSDMKEINDLEARCREKSIPFIGLTASNDLSIDNFKHETQAMFDFFNADETVLKTMIRSNPGIMLLSKGTVLDMWHHNDVPEFGETGNKFGFN